MALVLDTTYSNVFFTNVLDKLRDIIRDDRNYGSVYISPVYEDKGSFSVRVWGELADTTMRLSPTEWTKQYHVTVALYSVELSPDENFWKQYLADGERLYQLMANNISVSGSLGWFDGMVEDMRIHDTTAEEEAVEGLWTIKYDFVCRISRAN